MAKKGRFWPFLAQKSENPKFSSLPQKYFFQIAWARATFRVCVKRKKKLKKNLI